MEGPNIYWELSETVYLYKMLTRQNNKMVTLFFANKTKHNLEKGGSARAVHVIYETSNFF